MTCIFEPPSQLAHRVFLGGGVLQTSVLAGNKLYDIAGCFVVHPVEFWLEFSGFTPFVHVCVSSE